MDGKGAPLLLVVAGLAIVGAVLLTTRTPAPPIAAAPEAVAPAPDEPAADAGVPMTAPTTESGLPSPAAVAPSVAASTPARAPVSGVGNPAATPARAQRPGQPREAVEAGQPGNLQAEMAVAQALAAAGLSSADVQIATLGSAPAAPNAEAAAPEATPAAGEPPAPVRSTRDLEIPVPTGAKVPVVFYDQEPRPLPQQQALDRIAAEFSDTVSRPPAGYSQQEVWEAARKIADERYTVLYGFDAFNQISMQAAKEALKEKKAPSAQATTP